MPFRVLIVDDQHEVSRLLRSALETIEQGLEVLEAPSGEEALLEPHVKPFDITGKPMKNWVLVKQEGIKDDEQMKEWIQRAVKFVGKLPAK